MSIRSRRWSLWLCACALSIAAHAQANEVLTLQSTIERSLARNPELKSFGYELAIQAARVEQSRARPPLEVGAAVENVAGTGTHRGVDSAETTLTIGWVWERGVRAQRMYAAEMSLSTLQSEAQLRRLDIAAETARRFLAVLTHQHELEELKRSLVTAEETYAAVQARVAAAKVPEAEAARAYAQLERARLAVEHEEHELLTAGVRLTSMWGQGAVDDEQLTVVRGDLFVLPPLANFVDLNASLRDNPQSARLLTTQRMREAELQLATAQRRPAWQFTAGVRRFEASDDQALVFGVTMPLSNRAQSQGAITAARAQSEQVRAQSEALAVQLNTELFALYQEMKHAYTEVAALRDKVLPRMEVALTQSQYAYERGRYSYMELLAAQHEVADVRRALISAASNAHRYRIEIERLTGATLPAN
jgi:cobalt-zinc-cadmium efflux system outer membrane protein